MTHPETPTSADVIDTARQVGSDTFLRFSTFVAGLGPNSLFRDSVDLGVLPGGLQTVPYMKALISGARQMTDEQVNRGIQARITRGQWMRNIPQEYILSPSALEGYTNPQGQSLISPQVLHQQLTETVRLLETDVPISLRFAETADFDNCRLGGVAIAYVHPQRGDLPYAMLDTGQRMFSIDPVDVPRLVECWEDLSGVASSEAEARERIYERIGQLSADHSIS